MLTRHRFDGRILEPLTLWNDNTDPAFGPQNYMSMIWGEAARGVGDVTELQ